jgi:hypothetical protein
MTRKWPEEHFSVTVEGDEVRCRWPNGETWSVAMSRLSEVYIETNDSGPWGMDVWWVLIDDSGRECAFPQMACGEAAALERLGQLPGFQVNGMNSTANARFLCWRRPA